MRFLFTISWSYLFVEKNFLYFLCDSNFFTETENVEAKSNIFYKQMSKLTSLLLFDSRLFSAVINLTVKSLSQTILLGFDHCISTSNIFEKFYVEQEYAACGPRPNAARNVKLFRP